MADRAEVLKRVLKVTSAVLKTDESKISEGSDFVFDLGAESADSIALVAGFEKEFGIEMEEDAALEVQTVGTAVDFIAKHLK